MENEYTISVTAPGKTFTGELTWKLEVFRESLSSARHTEMSAGLVSLTLYIGQSCISLTPVTYYTCMGEVSRYLEQAADPLKFICQVKYLWISAEKCVIFIVPHLTGLICDFQAFNLTSNATESVDEILNESLKSKMPESGLQLFGVKQIETDNMSASECDSSFPVPSVTTSLPPHRGCKFAVVTEH